MEGTWLASLGLRGRESEGWVSSCRPAVHASPAALYPARPHPYVLALPSCCACPAPRVRRERTERTDTYTPMSPLDSVATLTWMTSWLLKMVYRHSHTGQRTLRPTHAQLTSWGRTSESLSLSETASAYPRVKTRGLTVRDAARRERRASMVGEEAGGAVKDEGRRGRRRS